MFWCLYFDFAVIRAVYQLGIKTYIISWQWEFLNQHNLSYKKIYLRNTKNAWSTKQQKDEPLLKLNLLYRNVFQKRKWITLTLNIIISMKNMEKK